MNQCRRPIIFAVVFICFAGFVALASTSNGWVAWDGVSRQASPIVEIQAATPDGIDLNYKLSGMLRTQVTTRNGEFTRLSVIDGGVYGEVGHPELPAVRKLVSIPYGAVVSLEIVNVNLATFSFDELGIRSQIYPVQAPIEKLPGALENAPFNFNETIYITNAFQLAAQVELGEIGIIRGNRFVEVIFYPLDVNPVTREVKVLSSADIRITFVGSDMELTQAKKARYNSFPFKALTDRLMMKTSMDASLDELNGMPEPPLLLIITDPNWETNPDLLDYVDWKFDKGFRPEFKTTDSTGTSASSIKAYIQNAYDNWPIPPTFVLLIGDINAIPYWTGSGSGSPATDLNYSMLEGSDYHADIDLGRWAIANLEDLTNIITKTVGYEQATLGGARNWEKKAVFMASEDNWQISEGTHNFVIDNYLDPDGYYCDKLYCHTYSATTQDVRDAHNNGRSLSIFSGHGNAICWGDGPSFSQSDVNGLTNPVYPFVQSYSCNTGEYTYSECFMETWIRTDNGAIGAMGATVSSYWTEDDILEKRVMEGFCANVNPGEENQTWIGGMMNYGKARYYDHFGHSGTTRRYFEMYNIIGDASIDLWTAVPVSIGVSHDAALDIGATSFDVTVTGMTDWALVCVHDENGEIYSTQYLFGDGTAVMDLGSGATTPGTLHIIVTGHDCDPNQGSVPIEEQNPPEPVTDLLVQCVGDDILLDWTPTGAAEYHIYISDNPMNFEGTPVIVAAPPYTAVDDAANFEKRFYQVISVD